MEQNAEVIMGCLTKQTDCGEVEEWRQVLALFVGVHNIDINGKSSLEGCWFIYSSGKNGSKVKTFSMLRVPRKAWRKQIRNIILGIFKRFPKTIKINMTT